ncbi:carboxylating nicotinate-nucleotide diphosphorylase [Membranicola marinus]|uniref:Probable nicotinate-nucleotide pyrophosphorylase [carboxylating] n=1 Tax=Membranihabitans marinus TaxID=1227546 RepID=A0A953L742_9BACT|nr:carboxylating nicotinate-nucleotide diphosphorylase [Membranihabitans marinus]MBY5958332.1 carboxylating nicotinate-nucleotide diphosphorylase [Membranihabitans marinus]
MILDQDVGTELQTFVVRGLKEDVGDGDHTSRACVPEDQRSKAHLLVKENCVLSGMEVAKEMIRFVDEKADIQTVMKDGELAKSGEVAMYVTMNTRALLKIERLLLNTVQRMCGISTMSRKYANAVEDFDVKILDTRKTTPQMRFLEKEAVRIGGCTNYRSGLYDRIMIKDNHIDAAGSMRNALHAVHDYLKKKNLNLLITVEVRSFSELNEAIVVGGFQRIMLDNFSVTEMREAVSQIDGRYEVEASGGITYSDLVPVARTGVDFISVGALTHGVKAVDLSLKILEA